MVKSKGVAALAAFIALVGLLAYFPGLSGPLLFDDKPALTGNTLVQIDGTSFDEWRAAALSSSSGPLRRPVTMLTFAANHAVEGQFSSVGLKAVNLAVHLVIAALFYFLAFNVMDSLGVGEDRSTRQYIAITAAGIWFLHPLHVSTVLYAVQRMAQLCALFVVLGLLVFMRYRRRWAEKGACAGEIIACALWLALLTMLATLSKENGVLLPWLVVVLEVCVFGGVWAMRARPLLRRSGWGLLVLPVLLVVVVMWLNPQLIVAGYAAREFSLEERVLTQMRVLWQYLGWFFIPDITDMGFQHDDLRLSRGLFAPVSTAVALISWIAALWAAFVVRRRIPLVLLGLLFFLVGHSLESSVYPLEMVYEHRNYLPSLFLVLGVAALLVGPLSRLLRVAVWYPVAGVLLTLVSLLLLRVDVWSNEQKLTHAAVQNHPESARSNFFYASNLLRRYEQRQQLGLSELDAADTLLLSRHYFERAYQARQGDVGALVMLYLLDSQFFPELRNSVNWWEELVQSLHATILQASDWNALDTLIDCLAKEICRAEPAKVKQLLDKLAERYPGSAYVQRYRYRYLASRKAEPVELVALLDQLQAVAPGHAWIYAYLLDEHLRTGDISRMYEVARRWLQNDHKRYSLPLIKGMFVGGAGIAEHADE